MGDSNDNSHNQSAINESEQLDVKQSTVRSIMLGEPKRIKGESM